jgi:DNA repair protein RecO (recombination protein O)
MTVLLHTYLLHSRPYRETSRLTDLFTAESGRIAGIWRGGRRSRQTAPQLFQPLLVDAQGSGELRSLRQIEPAGPVLMLSGVALFSGFYLNELLNRLLPRDEAQTALFVSYAQVLGELAEGAAIESTLRYFEQELLQVLGYGIDYAHAVDAAIDAALHYDFHPERGFTRVPEGRLTYPGSALLALAAGERNTQEALILLKRIHRQALARLLGSRPLKSRELFLASH